MRFRLRTLLTLLAVGPPLLWAAWAWWPSSEPELLPPMVIDEYIEFSQRLRSKAAKPSEVP
jgi:hypothetical protein